MHITQPNLAVVGVQRAHLGTAWSISNGIPTKAKKATQGLGIKPRRCRSEMSAAGMRVEDQKQGKCQNVRL